MDTSDIGAVQIAAGLFGSVSLGTTVFLLLQIVKGLLGERVSGRAAETVVLGTSFAAVMLAMLAVDTNWRDRETYVALTVGTLATTIIARGLYSQLFKASVEGVPVPAGASVPASAVTDSSDPYAALSRSIAPAVMARIRDDVQDDARAMTADETTQAGLGPAERRRS